MTTISDLTLAPLDMSHGVPMGEPGNYWLGMRFAVEIAIVSPPNLLPFLLGTSMLGGPRWRDVTTDVQGLTWSRGGAPGQRPIAGQLQMRLLNTSSDAKWSPWQSAYYGPGTTLRVVIGNGVDTLPQFTGLVQSWNEGSVGTAGGSGYSWVDVVAWESLFLLSEVNDHALAGVVGGGENVDARIARLLTQAAWQFGTDIVCTSPATFQATDLPSDVASELYKTVDSTDCTVWSGKDGRLKIRDRATGTRRGWIIQHSDVNPDSLVTENDDLRILSSVDLARVGGTFVHFENVGIAGRYQRRTTQRTDLLTIAEAANADLQRVADGMLARARTTYRAISFEIQSGQGLARMSVESDLTDRVTLDHGLDLTPTYTYTLRPNGSSGSGWTTTGAATPQAALIDGSDSSWVAVANGTLQFDTFTLPPGLTALRARIRLRVYGDGWIGNNFDGGGIVICQVPGMLSYQGIGASAVWGEEKQPWRTVSWTQADIDALTMTLATQSSDYESRVAEVFIDIEAVSSISKSVVTFSNYAICGFQHAVQVSGAGVYWTTTVLLDIEQDSTWEKTI